MILMKYFRCWNIFTWEYVGESDGEHVGEGEEGEEGGPVTDQPELCHDGPAHHGGVEGHVLTGPVLLTAQWARGGGLEGQEDDGEVGEGGQKTTGEWKDYWLRSTVSTWS